MSAVSNARRILDLRGAAYDRGRAQAELCPDKIADVTVAVTRRLRELGPALAEPKVIDWLDAQHAFTRDNDPDSFVEVQGIAEGFGIAPDALFACFFGDVIADLAATPSLADGCTAWAAPRGMGVADPPQGSNSSSPGPRRGGRSGECGDMPTNGPVVVKNRDVRGAQGDLQGVFRHEDPEWGGRRILCVSSLGCPGAFSSGINSNGLAVADTQVGTIDHGEGWLRSFLMTRILRECTTVGEAVALVFRVPHAGGGTLLMGDASGAVAAVELAHGRLGAEEPGEADFVARTEHFVSDRLRGRDLAPQEDIGFRNSRARLATLEHGLRDMATPFAPDAIRALMSRHGDSASAGLCRHDKKRDLHTISCAIYDCSTPALHFSFGPPCEGPWARIEP